LIEDYEPDYTTHMPSIYPAFAEYEEPLTKGQQVDETVVTMRAILPISTPSIRENMSNFTGRGMLLSSQVICMTPMIKDITLFNRAGVLQLDHLYLRSSVSMGTILPLGVTFFLYIRESTSPFN
jgi:hypothetical protein